MINQVNQVELSWLSAELLLVCAYIEGSDSSSGVTPYKFNLDGDFPKQILALWRKPSSWNQEINRFFFN